MSDVLERLARVIEERKTASPDSSYVASLHAQGVDAVLKKIGRETPEPVNGGKCGGAEAVVPETRERMVPARHGAQVSAGPAWFIPGGIRTCPLAAS